MERRYSWFLDSFQRGCSLFQETEAATLLAKYRKCQAELDDAEDRADAAHSALLMRGKTPKAGRSRAMTPAAARSRMRSRARSPEPRDYRDYESTDRYDILTNQLYAFKYPLLTIKLCAPNEARDKGNLD